MAMQHRSFRSHLPGVSSICSLKKRCNWRSGTPQSSARRADLNRARIANCSHSLVLMARSRSIYYIRNQKAESFKNRQNFCTEPFPALAATSTSLPCFAQVSTPRKTFWTPPRFPTVTAAQPAQRLRHKPPEQEVQVAFGQGAWVIHEGRRKRLHLFRMVLSHSRRGLSESATRVHWLIVFNWPNAILG